ncbi:hypothetical protein [Alcanivorax sp. 1008]|uniref:hypothetical protein n=1 Tax=Alcanivorax sp. 1008 TaxID=2816853 RepID=UPI001D274E9F|nr:hypothetical protein [Alcanivorax sp. 1008]MCC1497720.1 hypothetical protein [Alcanivorax sp. 1008]
MKFFRNWLLPGLLFANSQVWAIDLHDIQLNADITVNYDDNQSRAERQRDQVEDVSASIQASLSWFRQLSPRSLIALSGFAEGERFDQVDLLDRNTLGAGAAFRWQPDSSFSSPLIEWNVSLQDDDIGVDQRDSTVLKTQLFITRRFTDRITMSVGAEYRHADAESVVFDVENRRFFWNFDYFFARKYAAYFTYSHLRGDVFSSAQRIFCNGAFATDILPLINASTAIEPDDAYNGTFCGEWIAYRLDARTNTFLAGVNMPVGKSMSFDVSVMRAEVEADLGNHYERNMVRASLLKRF